MEDVFHIFNILIELNRGLIFRYISFSECILSSKMHICFNKWVFNIKRYQNFQINCFQAGLGQDA